MALRPLLPLPDYQRIYQVTYSVLETSGVAITHRACILFGAVGAMILREKYGLPATISAGCMALMVDEQNANVVVYGREEGGAFVNDKSAFHTWVECDGWVIDFMAPIMGIALVEDGRDWHVPRRMLQKRLTDRKSNIREIQHVGDFFTHHDRQLAESLIEDQSDLSRDLVKVCLAWFSKPPKPLKSIALGDNQGPPKRLVVCAPSIDGAW